jgi:hypothetical protein
LLSSNGLKLALLNKLPLSGHLGQLLNGDEARRETVSDVGEYIWLSRLHVIHMIWPGSRSGLETRHWRPGAQNMNSAGRRFRCHTFK